MARAFKIKSPRKPRRRRASVANSDLEDSDDSLLNSSHRPKAKSRDDNEVDLRIADFSSVQDHEEDRRDTVIEPEIDEQANRGVEEEETAINPFIDELRAQAGRKSSTGKLRKVSDRMQGKTFAVTTSRPTIVQRTLRPETKARLDALDFNETPQRSKAQRIHYAASFSPTREQKKTREGVEQEKLDRQLQGELDRPPPLRRSPRKQPRGYESDDANTTRARKKARDDPDHDNAAATEDTLFVGEFEDVLSTGRENGHGGTGDQALGLEQNDRDKLDSPFEPQPMIAGTNSSERRKRGRPRRKRPTGAAEEAQIQHSGPALPHKTRDSLKISKDHAADGKKGVEPSVQSLSATFEEQNSSRVQIPSHSRAGLAQARINTLVVDPISMEFSNDVDEAQVSDQMGDDANSRGASAVETRKEIRRLEQLESKRARLMQRRQAAAPTEGDEQHDSESALDRTDIERVFGQWKALRSIFKARKSQEKAVRDGDVRLKDNMVEEISELCKNAIEELSALKVSQNIDGDPAQDFIDISELVQALYTPAGGSVPDFNNVRRCKNIYSHLFPRLFKVLERMVDCYEAIDTNGTVHHQISYGHLGTLISFIEVILGLYGDQKGGARQYHSRPSADPPLVKPVTDHMCAPLKTVHKALTGVMDRHQRVDAQRNETLRQSQIHAAARIQEETDRRSRQESRRYHDKWQQLHDERRCAEPPFLPDSRWKMIHLAFPKPEPEEDANGEPFERVELFKPRVGPSLTMVEAARHRVWRMEEMEALRDGLRIYQGPRVLEKTIRRYCGMYDGRIQVLNPYNVTELATTAADMKRYLIWLQSKTGGVVEQWVKDIPEWVKPNPKPLPGQENDDADYDDDDGAGDADVHVDV